MNYELMRGGGVEADPPLALMCMMGWVSSRLSQGNRPALRITV